MQVMAALSVRPNVLVALLATMASLAGLAFGQSEASSASAPSDVLAGLVRAHPRLILTGLDPFVPFTQGFAALRPGL